MNEDMSKGIAEDWKLVKRHSIYIRCKFCPNCETFEQCKKDCPMVENRRRKSKRFKSNPKNNINSINQPDTEDINKPDKYGRTQLHIAILQSDVALVKELLERGANHSVVTKTGQTLIWFAIQSRCCHVLQLLIDHGCDINDGPQSDYHIHIAIEKGAVHLVQILLHHGADPNFPVTLSGKKFTPLQRAVYRGHAHILELLLCHGAIVDAVDDDGDTPFARAVKQSMYELLAPLKAHGANVHHKNKKFGNASVLHYAASKYCLKTLKYLLSMGLDPNITTTNTNETPLHFATQRRYAGFGNAVAAPLTRAWQYKYYGKRNVLKDGIIGELLKSGVNINAKNLNGETPLCLAVKNQCPYMVQELLDVEADIDVVDKFGNSPLSIAMGEKHMIILMQLMIAGANFERYLADSLNSLPIEIEECFHKFIIMKSVAGLKINSHCRSLLASIRLKNGIEAFEEACKREVSYMKTVVLEKNQMTLYNFLRADIRYLGTYNSRKVDTFLKFITIGHYECLPIYRDMLEYNYVMMRRYAPLVSRAEDNFNKLLQNQLPVVVADKIFNMLKVEDYKTISEALKVNNNNNNVKRKKMK